METILDITVEFLAHTSTNQDQDTKYTQEIKSARERRLGFFQWCQGVGTPL